METPWSPPLRKRFEFKSHIKSYLQRKGTKGRFTKYQKALERQRKKPTTNLKNHGRRRSANYPNKLLRLTPKSKETATTNRREINGEHKTAEMDVDEDAGMDVVETTIITKINVTKDGTMVIITIMDKNGTMVTTMGNKRR